MGKIVARLGNEERKEERESGRKEGGKESERDRGKTHDQFEHRGAGGALAMSAGDGREPTRLESPEHLLFESAVFL